MKIKVKTEECLVIEVPDMAFRMICFILIGLGSLVTIAVVLSGEGLHNGIIGYLFLIAGIIMIKMGNRGDTLELNKDTNQLIITAFEGSFSKAKTSVYKLSDIVSAGLDDTILSSSNSSLSGRTGWAVQIKKSDGEIVTATPYCSGKKKCLRVFETLQAFLAL